MEYQPAQQAKYPPDSRYSLLLCRDQIRLPQVQHERRVLRIPPAIHVQAVQEYRILYIAFHGQPNGIQIGRDFVTLSEIADVLEGELAGCAVHFGSCSTMRTKRANIDDFMNRTKADLVSGYRKQVDFIESTAGEMVWLQTINLSVMPYNDISH